MNTTNNYGATLEELLACRNQPRRPSRMQIAFAVGVLFLGMLAAALGRVNAQEPAGKPGEVDFAEVARWGNRVVVSGEGPRDGADVLFSQAMAPPVDDSDQWFVTVFGSSQDQATQALIKAFERDANLAPFIAAPPADPSRPEVKPRPWAHFNTYFADDPTQAWRFADFKIERSGPFPVVVIQAPRNGSFGGLVEQPGADGQSHVRQVVVDRIEAKDLTPQALRRRMQKSVELWCAKLQREGFQPPAPIRQASAGQQAAADEPVGSHGQNFPWGPVTPPAVPQVNPQWPPGGPATDPIGPAPAPAAPTSPLLTLLLGLLGGGSAGLLLQIGVWLWGMYRDVTKARGQTPVIPDAVYDAIAKRVLEKIDKVTIKDQ